MWTRKQLKDKAKTSFKMNYWKTVLAAFLVMVLGGVGVGSASGAASGSNRSEEPAQVETLSQEEIDRLTKELDEAHRQLFELGADPEEVIEGLSPVAVEVLEQEMPAEDVPLMEEIASEMPAGLIAAFLVVLGIIVVLAIVIALVAAAFVINPLMVGTSRFFAHNLNQRAEVKELAWGYDHNYRETVKTMFWRDIYTLLWGLLLVIPGIVKAYEYCMIPYLLADDPTLTKDEAFAQSKSLMAGNKWRAFVLDLSFLGWDLLSALTLGILTIFYVGPYKCMTKAALYEELRYGDDAPTSGGHHLAEAAGNDADQVPVHPFAAADAPAPLWDEE